MSALLSVARPGRAVLREARFPQGGEERTGGLQISRQRGTVVVPVNRKADPLQRERILPAFELILLSFFLDLEPVGLQTGIPLLAPLSAAS